MASESTKENLAKNKNAYGLPEVNQMPAKESRHEPVPEAHHYKAKYGDEKCGKRHEL